MAIYKLRCLLVFCAILPLAAQEEGSKLEEVGLEEMTAITGTLLRQVLPTGPPIISLNSEEISKTGLLDTASVLKTVPQISSLGISEFTTGTSANGNGLNTTLAQGVNIRALGQQATLTLVNGYRGAPGGQFGLYFEPANIPLIAIGRIEVLADGASAIYGSDAMAGVVNMILRKNFNGFEVRASQGAADSFGIRDVSAIFGSASPAGSFTVAGQHYYHSDLLASDRSQLFIADAPGLMAGNGRTARGFGNFSPNANVRVTTAPGQFTYYAAAPGATTFADLTPDTQNVVGTWYNSTALPEQKRDAWVANFDRNLAKGVKGYGQGYFSRREWQAYGNTGNSTLGVNSTITLPSTNPNFITGVPGAAASQTVLVSQFANLGALSFDGHETSWQGVLGVTADLWKGWQLDLNAQRAADRTWRLRFNTLNTCGLSGGSYANCILPAGEIAGSSGPLGTVGQTSAALAFNPFGANNAYVTGRIHANDLQEAFYDSDIVTAKVDGALFGLPGGEVRAAFGLEYRTDIAGQSSTTQSTSASAAQPIVIHSAKDMIVRSAFAEVVLPLIGENNTKRFAKRLDLSLAARHSDYDILSDSTLDPKFGLTWRPLEQVRVAASYSTSFRVNLPSTDEASGRLLRIRAVTDYVPAGGSANALQRGGGNPDLTPEKSQTWTLGADWRPASVQGLDMGLSYFDLKYKDVFDTPGAAVFNVITPNSESIYGAYIIRRPSTVGGGSDAAFDALVASFVTSPNFQGAVPAQPVNIVLDGRSQNAGIIETHGFDLRAAYKWTTVWGAIGMALGSEYFLDYKRSLTPTGALTSRVNQIDFPQRYRVRGQGSWSRNGFGAQLFGNYTPGYVNTYPTPVEKVGSYLTFDLGLSYDTADRPGSEMLKNVVVSLSVQNLFDKTPPFVAEFSQNFDSSIANMLQRVVSLQVGKKF